MNLLGVLSGVSPSFTSVYFISYYGDLDRHYISHLTVRFFGIISDVSQSVISIHFQAFYGTLFRFFSVLVTENSVDVLFYPNCSVCQFHSA